MEVTGCDTCQGTKRPIKNGKLPAKLSEETPQNKLCVDLIGTYKVLRKRKNSNIKIRYNDITLKWVV